ncbi:MAG: ElyC/SanA/YdcF family protein [Marinoscillum sp.]
MKLILKGAKMLVVASLLIGGLVLGLNFWIVSSTQDRIFYSLEEVPPKKVALLLGTSKRTTKGGTNKYFAERMKAAAELYHRGIVKHIIVSGDNKTVYYNEPRDMLNALKELGVPENAVTMDYAGFRTLDSVVRSKEIFGQDELMIITQDFHCYRALFIADYHNIDAVAYSADNKDQLPWTLAVREVFARSNAVLDLYIFNRNPKFLGEEETLPTD